MIFNESLRRQSMNVLRFDSLCGGLNAADNPTMIDLTKLSDSVNLFGDGGVLKCRGGIKSSDIYNLSGFEPINNGLTVETDGEIFRLIPIKSIANGLIKLKLLVIMCDDVNVVDVFEQEYSDNRTYDIGCLVFSDVPKTGCGIYIFTGVICNGTVNRATLYELNGDKDEVNETKAYIPTVLINGRGNLYDTLLPEEKNLPKPFAAEQMNLLSCGFKAAYNTDGVSLRYSLPKHNISESEELIIEYYTDSSTKYTFKIEKDSNISQTITIGGKEIYARVTKTIGNVLFYSGSTQYALPRGTDVLNNLIITAYRAYGNGLLCKMISATTFGKHSFVYGSEDYPDKIYWSQGDRALYFPENNYAAVGNPLSAVSALAKQNNLLIVFKAHEIYYISTVKTNSYDVDSALGGEVSRLNCTQSVNIAQLNGGIGTIYPETVELCANRIVFLGSDGNVYALTSTAMSQKQVYRISRDIAPLINKFNSKGSPAAVKQNGRYILLFGKNMVGFDYNSAAFRSISSNSGGSDNAKGVGWFSFVVEDLGENGLYLSLDSDVLSLGGRKVKRHCFIGENDKINNVQKPINWAFATKIADLGKKSKISRVMIRFDDDTVENSDMKICFVTDRSDVSMPINKLYSHNCGKYADLRLNLRGVSLIGVYLQGSEYVGVQSIEIIYYG